MNDPLQRLTADGVVDEILGRLKSGKEATISLVRRGDEVLAAKVYKDRATRSFKNNTGYKEGRKVRNSRTQRAMDGGGKFGRDAAEQAWKSAEADALYRLVGGGVRVPTPRLFYEGVLLMDVVRDAEGRPAPRLVDVHLDPAEALPLYADLVAQLISMLCCGLIHGDLSGYNILAAADGPTLIDFPQVISAAHNSRAEYYFQRDFDNLLRCVSAFDPKLSAHAADGRAIWRAYVRSELTPQFVPPPPAPRRTDGRPQERSARSPRPGAPDARNPQRFASRGTPVVEHRSPPPGRSGSGAAVPSGPRDAVRHAAPSAGPRADGSSGQPSPPRHSMSPVLHRRPDGPATGAPPAPARGHRRRRRRRG